MKRLLKIVFILGFTFVFTNCEKDDICDPNLTTTPRLIIEFYSQQNQSVPRVVTNLTVKDPNITGTMLFNGVDKIELPLKTFENTTTFEFTINSTATDGTLNKDTLNFNYTTQDIYVSRACGFKTYYDLSTTQGIVIEPDSDNWIKNKTIVKTKIESENDVHIKLFFRTFLVLVTFTSFSQETLQDSIPEKKERYGIRAGVDLYKITLGFFDEDYRGIELVGDLRLTRKIYLAAELGNEDKTVDDDKINFTTKGSYIRIGADYNMYENWLDMENLIYVGMRYGFSTFSQEVNSYQVYTPYPYFGEAPTIISGANYDGLSSHWLEVVLGVKAELINNLYAGFSVRFNYLLVNNPPDGFDNLYIPGFNKTYEGNFGFGFNYTLSYFIPIYKKKVKPVNEK